jgi:glycosyltransferase involved in cell wall biosynthesis
MERNPRISVVMPTYNGEPYLGQALDSLVAQNDEELEVVAVDDGSTDRTVDILHSFADRLRLKVLQHEHTGNWVVGTNVGLRSATGMYASILHQDDIWTPGRLREVRDALAASDPPALVVHPIWFIGPDGRRAGVWRCPLPRGKPLGPEIVTPRLLVQNFISVLGTVFPRQPLVDDGGLDEKLWYTADWDLWLRLAAMGPTWHVPKRLAAYRIHPETQTATRSAAVGDFRQQLEAVLDRHLLPGSRRAIQRAARFSVEVNVALAARSHGRPASIPRLLGRFLALGPMGWWRYLRYSRIVERAGSRIRVARRRPTQTPS